MDGRKKLADLLRRLADRIENCSSDELEEFLSAKPSRKSGRSSLFSGTIQSKSRDLPSQDWLQIAEQIRSLGTRDDGKQFLQGMALSKLSLEKLARAMNLPISKQDNAERLREKIIEFGIGSRLDSQAIRGK